MHTKVLFQTGDTIPTLGMNDRIFIGEGLFETLKVARSIPCFAFLHWQRLADSARQLGIPFDLSFEDWHDHLMTQIKQDNLYHGGLKVILSGGTAPRGLTEQGQISHMLIETFNYKVRTEPLRLMSASWLRDSANPIYQWKTINYLEAIVARRQALAAGFDDALFFNSFTHATETTCANLFLVKDNALVTPSLESGVLPGITRGRVLALCKQHQISCQESSLPMSLLEAADALFLTNSLQGIQRVSALDSINFVADHPLIARLDVLLSQA